MESNQLKDYELVNKFIEGDIESFELLISRHKNRVFTYILLIVKDRQLAEDIFQDTFIKVINSLQNGKYKDEGIFVSWVVRIAHNLIIDHFRKAKRLNTVSSDNCEIDLLNTQTLAEQTIEDEMIFNQTTKEVRILVNLLNYEQREVILLRHFGGLSYKEIADLTGISISTALGRMRYALKSMRKLINKKSLNLTIQ